MKKVTYFDRLKPHPGVGMAFMFTAMFALAGVEHE